MKFPSIQMVARALREAHSNVYWRGDKESDCEIRLQVYKNGMWSLRVGPSDYDLDHRGFWGASCLPRGRFRSVDLARSLLDQARDQYAMNA